VGQADILLTAIGKAQFMKAEWIKPGATVIDVGANAIPVLPCSNLPHVQFPSPENFSLKLSLPRLVILQPPELPAEELPLGSIDDTGIRI
jgi:hypothetical protein